MKGAARVLQQQAAADETGIRDEEARERLCVWMRGGDRERERVSRSLKEREILASSSHHLSLPSSVFHLPPPLLSLSHPTAASALDCFCLETWTLASVPTMSRGRVSRPGHESCRTPGMRGLVKSRRGALLSRLPLPAFLGV